MGKYLRRPWDHVSSQLTVLKVSTHRPCEHMVYQKALGVFFVEPRMK